MRCPGASVPGLPPCRPQPVMKITGTFGSRPRSSLATSQPLISGMPTLVITRSKPLGAGRRKAAREPSRAGGKGPTTGPRDAEIVAAIHAVLAATPFREGYLKVRARLAHRGLAI